MTADDRHDFACYSPRVDYGEIPNHCTSNLPQIGCIPNPNCPKSHLLPLSPTAAHCTPQVAPEA